MSVLSVEKLCKNYGPKIAVENISFEVKKNEIVGLLGPNGAGKTTTISMILGILRPTSGNILINNVPVTTSRSQALSHTNFAAVYSPLPGNLTVTQNLKFFARIYGVKNRKERIEELIGQYDLTRFRDTKSGVLSSGEQTRLTLAKAMLNHPELLLLDEPTASLDPSTAKDIRDHIKKFARDGNGTVLWTSHNMYEVEDVCDRVLFLYKGKVLLEGDPKKLPGQHGKKTLEELFIMVARDPACFGERHEL
jgi:ABC-2 type transport system ATP-binding protein